jgi:hypothetical protein
MEHPAEELFYCPNTLCKIEHPAGQILAQHALYVYSTVEATFSSPKFSAPAGDALTPVMVHRILAQRDCRLVVNIEHHPFRFLVHEVTA